MNENHSSEMIYCTKCGHQIHQSAAMCPQCGASKRSRGYKSKAVAAILAFFFGGLGIHRFYLGQWWGLFYLLFSWTAIPSFIALIEFIVFLVTDQKNWDAKYNEGIPAAPGEGSGAGMIAVLVIVGFFVFIFVLGVLTAIMIPAYHDYTLRTYVTEAMADSASVRLSVTEHMLMTDQVPQSNADLGLGDPHITSLMNEIYVRDGQIEIVIMGTDTELDGKSIIYSPSTTGDGYEVVWNCGSLTLEPRHLPASCRY